MEITEKLKKRFCMDYNIPINIYKEPYFSSRMELLDPICNTLKKYDMFKTSLNTYYESEQDFLEKYDAVKNDIISYLQNNMFYQKFNNDMNLYSKSNKNMGLPSSTIYKAANNNKKILSIDMSAANFSALSYYHPAIFNYKPTWKDFINQFTNDPYIQNSKYIRQVVMGNCNPKRQTKYESFLMDQVLSTLLDGIPEFSNDLVLAFNYDEIIFDITNMKDNDYHDLVTKTLRNTSLESLPLRIETAILKDIKGIDGMIKIITKRDGVVLTSPEYEIKGVNSLYTPFVIRKMNNESVNELDSYFIHEKMLSKLCEIPQIKLDLDFEFIENKDNDKIEDDIIEL